MELGCRYSRIYSVALEAGIFIYCKQASEQASGGGERAAASGRQAGSAVAQYAVCVEKKIHK
jgi:hypothetical protein